MPDDRVSRTVVEALAQIGMSMAELSRRIGRNEAYIQQFVKQLKPWNLKAEDCRAVASALALPEEALMRPRVNRRSIVTDRESPRESTGQVTTGEPQSGGALSMQRKRLLNLCYDLPEQFVLVAIKQLEALMDITEGAGAHPQKRGERW